MFIEIRSKGRIFYLEIKRHFLSRMFLVD